MATRFAILFALVGAILAPLAVAESTDCTAPVLIVTDGRLTQSSFAQNTTYWYGIQAQAGHSYAVEFVPAADNYVNSVRVQFGSISVFSPTDSLKGCQGASTVLATQNSGYAPVIRNSYGTGRRVSFTAQSAGFYLICITNVALNGAYSFRVVDTTLVNPRWSTYSGYDNAWSFLNVSDMTIAGTLTVYDGNGHAMATSQLNLPPGAVKYKLTSTSDMNLPRNNGGYATFSHNGPPGAIVADAYMENLARNMVFVSKFEPTVPQ